MQCFDFQSVLAPVTIEDFLAESWERQPLHVRGDTGRFSGIIDLNDIDRLVASAPDFDGQRGALAVRSHGDDTSEYPLRKRTGTGRRPAAVNQAFAEGHTIVINQLARIDPRVSALCASATEQLQHPVGCNSYLTPAHASGFLPHSDFHDTFFLQVVGSKRWSIWRPASSLPIRFDNDIANPQPSEPPFLEIDLVAGDMLYLPRGWIHAGSTGDDISLHMTLGALVTTWYDLLCEFVRTQSEQSVDLRHALPLGELQHGELQAGMNKCAGKWAEADTSGLDAALESLLARRLEAHHPPLKPLFAGSQRVDEVALTSVLRRDTGLRPAVDNDVDAGCRLVFAGTHIGGPAEARPAFEFVADRRQFQVSELPGLPDDAKIALASRMILQGCVSLSES